MKADRAAGEGLGWWWDQYFAVGEYLHVVLRYFEGNSSLPCFSEASKSDWGNRRDGSLKTGLKAFLLCSADTQTDLNFWWCTNHYTKRSHHHMGRTRMLHSCFPLLEYTLQWLSRWCCCECSYFFFKSIWAFLNPHFFSVKCQKSPCIQVHSDFVIVRDLCVMGLKIFDLGMAPVDYPCIKI